MGDKIDRDDAIKVARSLFRLQTSGIYGAAGVNGYGLLTDTAERAIRNLPAAPAKDVRAGALKEAAAYHESMAADEDALSAKYRGGSNPWFAHVQAAKWHREHAAAILALIPEAKP